MKRKIMIFKCSNPSCSQLVFDPLYRGPAGHAPVDLCYECWLMHWDLYHAKSINGGNWSDLDQILWLMCQGVNQSQAAQLVGRHRNSVGIWIRNMRRNPQLVPQWLADRFIKRA